MQTLIIQPDGIGQTLALVSFGVAILALMWVYRRHLLNQRRRSRGELPPSIAEMKDRVSRAQIHIGSVEEHERLRRLNGAVKVQRSQTGLSPEQQNLLHEITLQQEASAPPRGAS